MRRIGWQRLGLALALALSASPASAAADGATALGTGPAYETLGRLAVLHQGRIKPLDTLARQMLKQVYGAETIKLVDEQGRPTATWGHVGAMFDIKARPEFWDEQDILRVDYLPLKQMILAEPIKAELTAMAAKPSTSSADRERLEELAGAPKVSAEALTAAARAASLSKEDRTRLAALATRMAGDRRWLSPRELEEARVSVDGRIVAFDVWLADIAQRSEGGAMAQRSQLSELERKAYDAGIALRVYQTLRGDRAGSMDLDLFLPRPQNAAYLKHAGAAYRKIREAAHAGGDRVESELTPLERDSLNALVKYFDNLQRDDWKEPGTDKEFDARFSTWLREKSAWVPTSILLETDAGELEKAGFPPAELSRFQAAYRAALDAEVEAPGRLPVATASALVDAARALGEKLGGYPAPVVVEQEVHFNAFAPFYKSAWAYALGLVFLLLGLGITADRRSAVGLIGAGLYAAGMTAFLAGIGLEVYGFYHRVLISGWAPVTNMYETVIWVALVTAVLGLVLELIYRRTYTALAACGVAFLATLLAYKVPLLDANIKSLTPVLRSNYWLTIHVLTIVSSYAAFALAMGLGLIGTGMYLTATYRRSPGFGELARPLVPGVPLLGLGVTGLAASYGGWGPGWLSGLPGFYSAASLAGVGGVLTITGLGAVLGEAIARARFRPRDAVASAEELEQEAAPAATSVQTVTVGEAGGAVATLSRPSVAEIRARAASAPPPTLDARGVAMQATAGRIKALSNFIYRAMQVGVLLCAAGTILGGLWADVSWGRFWGWDPKEVWALITLLVYLIPLHGRFAGWVNTFTLVAASIGCFSSVVMAWYGVNFVLGVGLHSYGFTEGGGQGIVLAVCLAVLSVVGAAWWRRSLGQQRPPSAVA